MATANPTTLGTDGHCLIEKGTLCTTHGTTIPRGQDCCGRCPGKGHTSAILNNGRHLDEAEWQVVEAAAKKMGVNLGGKHG